MSTPRSNRSRQFIIALVVTCVLAGLISRSAMGAMRQDDLDRQSFAALEHGNTSELAALLEQGADPNYVPQNAETGLSALLTNLRQGYTSHGLPMLGYALNGLSNEDPRRKLTTQQFKAMHKAMHLVPPSLTCTDPVGKMRVLLEHHADPNRSYTVIHPRYASINPLLQAVGQKRADAVQLLLQHGADPDAQTASGDTARKVATRYKYASILALMK